MKECFQKELSCDIIIGAMKLVEMLFRRVTEKNEAPEKVFPEQTVRIGEDAMLLIFRDNGDVMRLSNPVGQITFFRCCIVSTVMDSLNMRKHPDDRRHEPNRI